MVKETGEKLFEILKGVTGNVWELVCREAKLPDEYIVYNSWMDTPEDFGDGKAQAWINHIQVHLYTVKNYKKIKRTIKNALETNGFTISEIESMNDRESGHFHICFSGFIQEEREE